MFISTQAKSVSFRVKYMWVQNPALPIASRVTLENHVIREPQLLKSCLHKLFPQLPPTSQPSYLTSALTLHSSCLFSAPKGLPTTRPNGFILWKHSTAALDTAAQSLLPDSHSSLSFMTFTVPFFLLPSQPLCWSSPSA